MDYFKMDEIENMSVEELKAERERGDGAFYEIAYGSPEKDYKTWNRQRDTIHDLILRRRREQGLMSDLEIEFRDGYDENMEKINQHLDAAMKELLKAQKIADDFGIHFNSNISPISQTYIPYGEKYKKLMEIEDLFEDFDFPYDDDYDDSGWAHSAICY